MEFSKLLVRNVKTSIFRHFNKLRLDPLLMPNVFHRMQLCRVSFKVTHLAAALHRYQTYSAIVLIKAFLDSPPDLKSVSSAMFSLWVWPMFLISHECLLVHYSVFRLHKVVMEAFTGVTTPNRVEVEEEKGHHEANCRQQKVEKRETLIIRKKGKLKHSQTCGTPVSGDDMFIFWIRLHCLCLSCLKEGLKWKLLHCSISNYAKG